MPSPTPAPSASDTEFDPLIFWIQHRNKIVLFAGLLALALSTYAISELLQRRKLAGAQQLFAAAQTSEDFRKIITQYPGTTPAGSAYLMLAAQQRQAGKLDESSATLRAFAEQYPEHPLISGAWTSLAANLEAQGKPEEALAMYQKVSTGYANSFSAPAALMAQARLQKATKPDEARRLYEQVISQFSDNILAQQAAQEMRALKK